MNVHTHEELKSHIWDIANRLRGPYRPPQYRLVMLPLVVLRRLGCVLEPTKDAVLKAHEKNKKLAPAALEKILSKAADPKRKNTVLYNTSQRLEAQMYKHARNLEFEVAAKIRDTIEKMKQLELGLIPGEGGADSGWGGRGAA